MELLSKHCHNCGHPLRGRTDKKFCNDMCRNAYHNRRLQPRGTEVRRINSILLRNRMLLETFKAFKHVKPSIAELTAHGFVPAYSTHERKLANGTRIICSYDYGYALVKDSEVRIYALSDMKPESSLQAGRSRYAAKC